MNSKAPSYLSDLIQRCDPNAHYSLRTDSDHFILALGSDTNFKRSQGAVSVIAPKPWNGLPYIVRCQSDLQLFKNI